jgi:hypothetical protein
MAVDEHGVPARNIEPSLFKEDAGVVAKQVAWRKNQIWITEPLKQAAKALRQSWGTT